MPAMRRRWATCGPGGEYLYMADGPGSDFVHVYTHGRICRPILGGGAESREAARASSGIA
eukprot:181884-Heterocapsa_arctica.AAC.1